MSEELIPCPTCNGQGGDAWDGPCTDCLGQGAIPDEDDDADEVHDAHHPWMFAGCADCAKRADWIERLRMTAAPTGPTDGRESRPCPKCGQMCHYDGWGLVHGNGLGIGSCAAPTGPAYDNVACHRGEDDNGRAYCVGHGRDWPCAAPNEPDPHPESPLAWLQIARGVTAYCLHCDQPMPCAAYLERHDEGDEHREICQIAGCRYPEPRTDAAVGR